MRLCFPFGVVCLLLLLAACSEPGGSIDPAVTEQIELVCDAGQTRCSAILPSTLKPEDSALERKPELELRLLSPALPALQPVGFELTISGKENVPSFDGFTLSKAWIEGRDMFMGEHALEHRYQADLRSHTLKGMIPVCVTGSDMVWRLKLQLIINNTKVLAYADLRSLNPK